MGIGFRVAEWCPEGKYNHSDQYYKHAGSLTSIGELWALSNCHRVKTDSSPFHWGEREYNLACAGLDENIRNFGNNHARCGCFIFVNKRIVCLDTIGYFKYFLAKKSCNTTRPVGMTFVCSYAERHICWWLLPMTSLRMHCLLGTVTKFIHHFRMSLLSDR